LTSSEPPSDAHPDGPADGPPESSDGTRPDRGWPVSSDPSTVAPPLTPTPSEPAPVADDPAAPPGIPGRPGTGTFTIEGRAAPALFVVVAIALAQGV